MRQPSKGSMSQKILILRLSSIGDIILTSPLVRAVREKFPNAQIDFLIKKEFADVMRYNPNINNLICFDKKEKNALKNLKQQIRNEKYDWCIDIHKNLRTRLLKSGIPFTYKTQYNKQIFNRTLLVWFKINRFKNIKPAYLKYFEAVEKFGIQYDGKGTEVFVPKEISIKIKSELIANNYKDDKKLIVICPAASFLNKRWKSEGFAEVADYLIEKHNAFVVFLGGKQDIELCEKTKNLMKNNSVNFAGKFTLIESAALLKECNLCLTNDTGMLHLAQSQKKATVAIFGATVKELGYFPLPEKSIVVEKDLPCRPCTHNGLNKCPKKHFKCMNDISVEDVKNAVDKILQ